MIALPLFQPRRALTHPLFWFGLVGLLINDHLLKGGGVIPAFFTGKLSDGFGMWVAPVALATLFRIGSPRGWLASHLAVGFVFAAINLSTFVATSLAAAMSWLGVPWQIWSDPTDLLVAIPALFFGYRVLGVAAESSVAVSSSWQRAKPQLGLWLGLAGCIATSRIPPASVTVAPEGVVISQGYEKGFVVVDPRTGRAIRHTPSTGHETTPVIVNGQLVSLYRDGDRGGLVTHDLKNTTYGSARAVWPTLHPELHVAAGGIVIYRGYRGSDRDTEFLFASHVRSGKQLWSHAVESARRNALLINRGVILIGHANTVQRIDPQSGNINWTAPDTGPVACMTTIEQRAYLLLNDGHLMVLNLSNGERIQNASLSGLVGESWTPRNCALTASKDRIFVKTDLGLSVLDPSLNTVAARGHLGQVVAYEGLVVAATWSKVYGLDPQTGAVRWMQEVDSNGKPTIQGGRIYLGGYDATKALDGQTGNVVWTWPPTAQ